MRKHLLATALCAVLAAGTLTGPPAGATAAADQRGSAPASAERPKACDAHGFKTKVRNVTGDVFVKLTRLREKTYAGPTTIKKGTSIQASQAWSIESNVTASGGMEMGAGVVLKKLVNVFSNTHAEVQWMARVTAEGTSNKTITVNRKVRIPRATSVVFYVGWMGARGTGEYSYCSALDGSGEGFVKWQKVRWQSFGGRGSGAQNCRVKAYSQIASAAKNAMCV